ncbi:MAG TPA: hypothetical protein VGH73_10180 [Thermoanaerobaculia bacterium]
MNSKSTLLLLLSLIALPAFGASFFGPTDGLRDLGYSCYGCNTPVFTGSVVEMRQQGIWPNTAIYSAPDTDRDTKITDGTCRDTDYLALARISGTLATSGNVPRPFILDLSSVIFGTNPPRQCSDTNPSNQWHLLTDWQSRLDRFKSVSGSNFNTSTVGAIVLFTEVANENGFVVSNSVINQIAAYVKQLWPGIPVMAGYPTAANHAGYGMQYTPNSFPYQLDYIATWDYTVTSPADRRYAGDATDPGAYSLLLARLSPTQKLLYNVGAFSFAGPPTTCPARSPINGERFDLLVRNWCAWSFQIHGDRSVGLVTFLWGAPQSWDPNAYGAQRIINWELNNCGGTALRPALVSVANVVSGGGFCFQ